MVTNNCGLFFRFHLLICPLTLYIYYVIHNNISEPKSSAYEINVPESMPSGNVLSYFHDRPVAGLYYG